MIAWTLTGIVITASFIDLGVGLVATLAGDAFRAIRGSHGGEVSR